MTAKSASQPGPFKRTGLHRLDCADDCGAYAYATVAMLERHGCPGCPCGAAMLPENLELAAAVCPDRLEFHVSYETYQRELGSVLHGQAPSVNRGRSVRPAEEIAAERVARERADRARARQLSGLRRGTGTGTVTVDVIPF